MFCKNGYDTKFTENVRHDWGVDLTLNDSIAVRVKFQSSPVGPRAVQEVFTGKVMYSCSEAWVVTNSTFSEAAELLARSNGLRLINGDELRWLADNPDSSALDHQARYKAAMAERVLAELDEALQAIFPESSEPPTS